MSSVSEVEGGAERSLLELARALRAAGHTVSLAAWGPGALPTAFEPLGETYLYGAAASPARPLGGATDRVPALRPLVRLLAWVRLRFRWVGREADWLVSAARASGADVVHTNCDFSIVPAAAAVRRTPGVPWVAHVRDHWRAWFHPRVARALRSANAVVAPSAFLARRFGERGIAAVVVPNPVEGEELRRSLSAEERARLRAELVPRAAEGPGGDPFLVAVVGRLDEQKGVRRVIDAAAYLAERGDDRVRFLVAGRGTGPFEAELRRDIAASGLEDRVRLLGFRDDLRRWLPAVDALAVPSTGEPFGRMIVEGMHAGLAVVAFRDGAAPELIDNDRTGVLIPLPSSSDSGSPVAGDRVPTNVDLADALLALARDPARAARLGAAAREAATAYVPGAVVAEMEEVYLRCAAEASPGS